MGLTSVKLTQAEVKRLLDYDSGTGIFTWRVRNNGRMKIGGSAGSAQPDSHGKQYLVIGINGKHYSGHRLAWLYVFGQFPDGQIDHVNGDGCDNRIANLRDVSHSENQRNAKLCRKNTSGYCGVYWDKRTSKWAATIGVNSISKRLGFFINILDAVAARKKAEVKLGFHPNHGQKR